MSENKCKVTFKKDPLTGWKLVMDPTDDCKKTVEETSRKLGKYGYKYLEKRLVDSKGLQVLKKTVALRDPKE